MKTEILDIGNWILSLEPETQNPKLFSILTTKIS
jgi:hypothetical protein